MDRHEWNERYASQPLLWTVDPNPFLSGEIGDRPPGRALDLGAGEGRTTLWLAERGWRVTAVDFSDMAIDRGRQRAEAAGVGGSVEWICADLVDFDPTGSGPFDLVLMMFIHLLAPDRRRLLRAAAGTLAPGGVVLAVGYDTANATDGQGGCRDPDRLFSVEDLVADLEGLRIERAERLVIGEAIDAIVRAVRD